jgi:hypothetical protein
MMNEITRERKKPGPKPRADRAGHENAERPARIPMQAGLKMDYSAYRRDGYVLYLAIDKPGMLEQMQRAWWQFVTDDRGNKITCPAGGGFTHYLMEIEQKYYDEDMAKQQASITETTKKAARLKEGEYLPEGSDGVLTREVIA